MRPNPVGWFLVALFGLGGIAFTIAKPEIWLGQIWIVVAAGLAVYYVLLNRRADAADRLRRMGVAGEARILEAVQTGVRINDQPRVKLRLSVSAPGIPAFETEDTYTVPLIALGRLTDERPLPVSIDPDRPENFAIDW